MDSLLYEMKDLLFMSLNGASDFEMLNSSSFTFLEFYFGYSFASAWYEFYIELTTDDEKRDLLKLPLFNAN